jgi:hypothetical protein
MKPVIILAFANDRDAYLENLKSEKRCITDALRNHSDKGFIQVETIDDAAIDNIFYFFDRYNDRIAIFHYGGHANGTHLQLEKKTGEAQMARSAPLAELMGQQKTLKLVFLNGCATQKQVNLLLAAGVKAVIATSVPVDDKIAMEFAAQFYSSLASDYNIKQAFKNARARVNTPEGSAREINIYTCRDIYMEAKETPEEDELPWGLYCNVNHPEVLEWKLPAPRAKRIIEEGEGVAPLEVNAYLIDALSRAIAGYSRVMRGLIEDYQRQIKSGQKSKANLTRKEIRKEIIESYPFPMGEQLRRLFQNNTRNINRLNQLVLCYRILMEYLCFIMLSQLWDEAQARRLVRANEDFIIQLSRFFERAAEDYQAFNYLHFTETIAHIFQRNEIKYFIDEFSILEESLITQNTIYDSLLVMEDIKIELGQNSITDSNEISRLCVKAEGHLGIILKTLVFLVEYELTTIKKIIVKKERHKAPRFWHTMVELKGRREGLKDTEWNPVFCTDDNSVILLRGFEDNVNFLSLSPFVIDHNAFSCEDLSRLYFYSYRDVLSQSYCYRFLEDEHATVSTSDEEDDEEIKDEYQKLKNQFEAFQKSMLTL